MGHPLSKSSMILSLSSCTSPSPPFSLFLFPSTLFPKLKSYLEWFISHSSEPLFDLGSYWPIYPFKNNSFDFYVLGQSLYLIYLGISLLPPTPPRWAHAGLYLSITSFPRSVTYSATPSQSPSLVPIPYMPMSVQPAQLVLGGYPLCPAAYRRALTVFPDGTVSHKCPNLPSSLLKPPLLPNGPISGITHPASCLWSWKSWRLILSYSSILVSKLSCFLLQQGSFVQPFPALLSPATIFIWFVSYWRIFSTFPLPAPLPLLLPCPGRPLALHPIPLPFAEGSP